MKELKLESRKPSERLRELVNRIPELYIDDSYQTVNHNEHTIYDVEDGDICHPINTYMSADNPLLNTHVLRQGINKGIRYIDENLFCEVLDQHIEMVENKVTKQAWWETQEQMWVIVMGKFDYLFRVVESDIQSCNYGYISSRDNTIVFSSIEGATEMCLALNNTLRGEKDE